MFKASEKQQGRVVVKSMVNMFGEREDRIWGGLIQNAERRLLWR